MIENPKRRVLIISKLGLQRLKDGDRHLSDDTRLALEIVARHPKGLTEQELDAIVDEAIQIHGSAAAAIEALKLGCAEIAFDD